MVRMKEGLTILPERFEATQAMLGGLYFRFEKDAWR